MREKKNSSEKSKQHSHLESILFTVMSPFLNTQPGHWGRISLHEASSQILSQCPSELADGATVQKKK